MESALKKLVNIDGDVLYWVREWVNTLHEDDVFLFGAPFEADAQLVHLEREGLVDGILTCDADVWFLGGQNVLKGYRSRKKGPYAAIFEGKTAYDTLNTLSVEQKALASAFAGNDYIGHLRGFTIGPKVGDPGKAVAAAITYQGLDTDGRSKYLQRLEATNRWSQRGQEKPASNFASELLRTFRTNFHYPVYRISTDDRQHMYDGKYTVTMVPLNPFEKTGSTTTSWTNFLGGAFHVDEDDEVLLKEAQMELWARCDDTGNRIPLQEPPLPKLADDNGVMVERPHGAVLDFNKRPPFLVNNTALMRYLRCLGMRIKSDHPRSNTEVVAHPGDPDNTLSCIRYSYRGLVELVGDALVFGRQPITAAEAKAIGTEDPIPFEYASEATWSLRDNEDKVISVCKECDITDDKITDWFGVNNANRSRGMKLFRNGHLDWTTLRVREARLIANGHRVYVFQAAVTASQRVRSYNALLVYDREDTCIIPHPASSCECVVHLGPGCSHQLCLALTIVMGSQLRVGDGKILPSNIVAVQRLGMTISYAYGRNSINRSNLFLRTPFPKAVSASESEMSSLEVTPEPRKRDEALPLIPFVTGLIQVWRHEKAHDKNCRQVPLRLEHIQEDTAKEIAMYPRTPEKQRDVDELRERMYNGYLKKILHGWDWSMPPLILYYLVYTRQARLERLEKAPARHVAVEERNKVCKSCGGTVRGRATKQCPICGAFLIANDPQWVSTNNGGGATSLGKFAHILSLYGSLPGRWKVHEWEHGDEDRVTVRNMGDEGMIGKFEVRACHCLDLAS